MAELNDRQCTAIFEELGYYADPSDNARVIRVNGGKARGPKAFAFAPLDEDERIQSEHLEAWLTNVVYLDGDAVLAAIRRVLD